MSTEANDEALEGRVIYNRKRPGKYVKGANPVPPQLKGHTFPKGRSGNAAGGKRRLKFTDLIEKLSDVICDDPEITNPNKLTYAELLVRGMFKAGIKGDVGMTGILFDRAEGRVVEKTIVADITEFLPELASMDDEQLGELNGRLDEQLGELDREIAALEAGAGVDLEPEASAEERGAGPEAESQEP